MNDTAQENMAIIDSQNILVTIVFGIGDGARITEMINNSLRHNNFFILDRRIEYKSPRTDRGVTSIVNPDDIQFQEALMGISWEICIGKFILFVNRPAMDNTDDLQYYREKYLLLDRFMSHYNMNINTIIGNYRAIQENVIKNMATVAKAPGIEQLFEKFKGHTAIVCAAGPSLNKQLPLLKTLKGKAFIFAVDTAARALQEAGIEPDMIVVIDYSEINERKFKGLKDGQHYFLVSPTIRPASMDLCKGRSFIVYQNEQMNLIIDQAFGNKGYIPGGGSVVHYAMQGAAFMEFDKIIIIGMDLAHTGGKSHADGTMYDNGEYKKIFNNLLYKTIKDQYGNDVDTTLDMLVYIHETEHMALHLKPIFINSTEGGANIKGIPNIPFIDAVTGLAGQTDYIQMLAAHHNAPTINKEAALGVLCGIRDDLHYVASEALSGATHGEMLLDMAYDLTDMEKPHQAFNSMQNLCAKALENIMTKVNTHRLLECLFMKDVYLYHSTYNHAKIYKCRRDHILYSGYKQKVLFTKVMECANTFRNRFDEMITVLEKEL